MNIKVLLRFRPTSTIGYGPEAEALLEVDALFAAREQNVERAIAAEGARLSASSLGRSPGATGASCHHFLSGTHVGLPCRI